MATIYKVAKDLWQSPPNPFLTLSKPIMTGDIISLSIFGRSIIVLNSAEAAFDLLHKRSLIYSGRPYLHMGGDL